MNLKNPFTGSIAFLILVMLASHGDAVELPAGISLHGFGTIGINYSNADTYGFRANMSQESDYWHYLSLTTDSKFGVQLDKTLWDSIDITLQAVLKDRADDGIEESIEWAFLRKTFAERFTVRAGRLGTDLFMLSDYRNVGFAYLWVRPVIEFYGPLVFSTFDGLDCLTFIPWRNGQIQFKGFYGKASNNVVSTRGSADISMKDYWGGNITYEDTKLRLRASYVQTLVKDVDFQIETLQQNIAMVPDSVWPEKNRVMEELDPVGDKYRYYNLGFAYSDGWELQGELGYIDSEFRGYPSIQNGYLSVGYRFGKTTPYIVFSSIKTEDDMYEVPAPDDLNASTTRLYTGAQAFFESVLKHQRTISIGARHDITDNICLKGQFDSTRIIDGDGALFIHYGPDNDSETLNTFTITMDFIF